MKQIGVHCFVTGIVQGVWFRANTQREAQRLGLTGWVRNLPDGRVEVMAYGSEENILALCVWLKSGPPKAKVTDLTQESLPWQSYQGFDVL